MMRGAKKSTPMTTITPRSMAQMANASRQQQQRHQQQHLDGQQQTVQEQNEPQQQTVQEQQQLVANNENGSLELVGLMTQQQQQQNEQQPLASTTANHLQHADTDDEESQLDGNNNNTNNTTTIENTQTENNHVDLILASTAMGLNRPSLANPVISLPANQQQDTTNMSTQSITLQQEQLQPLVSQQPSLATHLLQQQLQRHAQHLRHRQTVGPVQQQQQTDLGSQPVLMPRHPILYQQRRTYRMIPPVEPYQNMQQHYTPFSQHQLQHQQQPPSLATQQHQQTTNASTKPPLLQLQGYTILTKCRLVYATPPRRSND